ncbi:MAG TPA: hypothetical protein VNR51_01645 [Hyphomicrobium sp.]|nr:hypothetical protein [Hyphomicrobium sp.]
MASPKELVECVAEAFGLPVATVGMHDRALSDAGLRTKGGRGLNVPPVTAADAARLMIAVSATPVSGAAIANTVEQCRQYGALQAVDRRGAPLAWRQRRSVPSSLRDLPAGHTVEEALIGLIIGASDGSLGGFTPRVTFYAPVVRVLVSSVSNSKTFEAIEYGHVRPSSEIGMPQKGLVQERQFGADCIEAVGRLLARS